MTVGVWDPAGSSKVIDAGLLGRFLALAGVLLEQVGVAAAEAVAAIKADAALQAAGLGGDSWVMRQEADAWQAAGDLINPEIVSLICLFTLLERDQSGWDAGSKSPVIPLVKLLKERGAFAPELRKWIKLNTDNRYLPNGSVI